MQLNYLDQKLQRELRLIQKNDEYSLMHIINEGTNCSPIESEVIVQKSKEVFGIGEYSLFHQMRSGQMIYEAVCSDEPAGKPLSSCERQKVILTVISLREDLEVHREFGSAARRRQQIKRISEEAYEQGGLLTQEDLSLIFNADVRTIRADAHYLRKQGVIIPTRGTIKDIGPGVTHKEKAIELFLQLKEPLEISRQLNHSLTAIERYIQTFCRVVYCQRQFRDILKTAMVIGISVPLANLYWEIHNNHLKERRYRQFLKEIEATGRSYYDTVDFKKKPGPTGSWVSERKHR